jgi:enoyl-CoA hydratase
VLGDSLRKGQIAVKLEVGCENIVGKEGNGMAQITEAPDYKRSTFKWICYEKDKEEPAIVYVTLNRPDKRNAISIGRGQMTEEIIRAMAMVNEDPDVKVAVFRGAGTEFSAGYDLEQVYRVYGGTPTVRPYQRMRLIIDDTQILGFVRAVLNCTKVTIAQVQGWCIEAGIWLVEACDIAVADEKAKFAHRGNRLAFGGFPVMPLELLGGHAKKTTELLITGRTISGLEAEQIGIITKAVPRDDLEAEVYNLAKAVCVVPRDAIVIGKLARRHTYDQVGAIALDSAVVYHTLGTNIRYADDEKELMFIRKREEMKTAKEAFHNFHQLFEKALEKTKYFKSYSSSS